MTHPRHSDLSFSGLFLLLFHRLNRISAERTCSYLPDWFPPGNTTGLGIITLQSRRGVPEDSQCSKDASGGRVQDEKDAAVAHLETSYDFRTGLHVELIAPTTPNEPPVSSNTSELTPNRALVLELVFFRLPIFSFLELVAALKIDLLPCQPGNCPGNSN